MARVTVLEVGPNSVRVLTGGRSAPMVPVDPGLARAAVEWIDDPVGLYDDHPVAVADLWRTVMTTLVGERCDSVVLVHPDDWPRHRIDRVVAAANAVADEVVPVRRSDWRTADGDGPAGEPVPRPARRRIPLLAVTGVGFVPLALLGAAVAGPPPGQVPGLADTITVAEGRVEASFPRSWRVDRVTGGPGSRRLQASSPADPDLAVHLTQSYVPESTLAQAATVLSREIADQPAGVFVDFDAAAKFGELPVLRYREIRPGRIIEWTVLLVGATRIGVGCQSPPGRAGEVLPVCAQVAASAAERGQPGGTDRRP